jgi:hypothetical protein
VGQRVDGRVEFEISDDKMAVTITVSPATHGGNPAERSVVLERLRDAGIVHGLDEDRVKSLVARCTELGKALTGVVAKGTPPEPGSPAKFELLVHPPQRPTGEEGEDEATGTVDYHFDAPIINVHEGQEVARRTAPTAGTPGTDVLGGPVAPPPSDDRTPRPMLRIVATEAGGITRYTATEAGELRFDETHNTITVATEYIHKGDVTVAHGDIIFVRDVAITGNVVENAVIRAGGNVRIVGLVGAATIEAGGNITVSQGIVAGGRGLVSARGNVDAAFAENAVIRAGGDVIIRKGVLNSDISASGSVVCTQGRGMIIGGITRAARVIEVRRLGAPTSAETQVIVGLDWALLEHRDELRTRIAWCTETIAKSDRVLGSLTSEEHLARLAPDVRANVAKAVRQRELLADHLKTLTDELAVAQADLSALPGGVVKVSGEAFAGVKVRVGDARMTIADTVRYCAITEDRESGEVTIGALV